jgi:predicted transcriptional regulator of viral defense system
MYRWRSPFRGDLRPFEPRSSSAIETASSDIAWTRCRSEHRAVCRPPFLTAPLPAYVSFRSALSHHGLIEQIPREISVASLDRARRIETSVGVFAIHHLAPELLGGYRGAEDTGYLATAEKALFDTVYVRAATGSRAFFPELALPAGFADPQAKEWTAQIASRRLQTLVSRRLDELLLEVPRE